jgi:cysteine desulfurase
LKLHPQLHGGFQQGGLRPGTENVSLAVGFHEALRIAIADLPQRSARMTALRDELERSLKEFGQLESVQDSWQLVEIIGEHSPRLPNTTCVSFPGLNRQALVMALDMAGVACSTGSACASGSSEPSPTLIAMGVPYHVVQGAIRLSVGAFTTAEEVAEASRRILNAVKHLRSQKSG